MELTLAYSTCPNDTFTFYALTHGKVSVSNVRWNIILEDIRDLNDLAASGVVDVIKISYGIFGNLMQGYSLLDAGSAMGNACGPLLICRTAEDVNRVLQDPSVIIAIPGRTTTANLLLNTFLPGHQNRTEMIFHEVMPSVLDGTADAGVIIHENRFVYKALGLHLVRDLGEYWEAQTRLPIPLGAIVARNNLGPVLIQEISDAIAASVHYAWSHPEETLEYVRSHAQEMDETVMWAHIRLYVNAWSESLGRDGHLAVGELIRTGEQMKIFPEGSTEMFRDAYLHKG